MAERFRPDPDEMREAAEVNAWDQFVADRDAAAQQRTSEHLKAPTYRDEVRSDLLRRMREWPNEHTPFPVYLGDEDRADIVDFLLDEVMEAVEHAVQICRLERGVLPYEED